MPDALKTCLKRKSAKKGSACSRHWKGILCCCVFGVVAITAIALVLLKHFVDFDPTDPDNSIILKKHSECWSSDGVWNNATEIIIPSNSCNNATVTTVDFAKYKRLRRIEIGDESFMNVNELNLVGLSKLESVVVGENCFTKSKNWYGNEPDRRFYLKNCPLVKELRIGRYSFSDYTGCEIENVDALEVIEMGDMDYEHECSSFYYASLELKSILIPQRVMTRHAFAQIAPVRQDGVPKLQSHCV